MIQSRLLSVGRNGYSALTAPFSHQSDADGFNLILLAIIAVGAVIYWTGQWSVLVFSSLYFLYFVISHHDGLRAVFISGGDLSVLELRRQLYFRFLLAAVAITCVAAVWPDIYLFAAACLYCVLGLHLMKLDLQAKEQAHSFPYFLLKAAIELLVSITVVLALGSAVSLYVSTMPADTTTLGTLVRWEEGISRAHAALDALKFSATQSVVLILALLALRLAEMRFSRRDDTTRKAWLVIQPAAKRLSQAALLCTIAASFTFLGTKQDTGTVATLQARIRDMTKNYTQFRREIQNAMNQQAKRELIERSLAEAPRSVIVSLQRAAKIKQSRRDLMETFVEANERYELDSTHSAKLHDQYEQEISKETELKSNSSSDDRDAQTSVADREALLRDNVDLTPPVLNRANSEIASAFPRSEAEAHWTSEVSEEFSAKAEEFIVSPDRLTEHSDLFKLLTEHHPLIGELLSTVNDAFNDYVYDKLAGRAERIAAEEIRDPVNLRSKITASASMEAKNAPLDWQHYDSSWRSRTEHELAAQANSVHTARHQLEVDALQGEKRRVEKLASEIREFESEFHRIGTHPGLRDQLQLEENVRQTLADLLSQPLDQTPLAHLKGPDPQESSSLQIPHSWDFGRRPVLPRRPASSLRDPDTLQQLVDTLRSRDKLDKPRTAPPGEGALSQLADMDTLLPLAANVYPSLQMHSPSFQPLQERTGNILNDLISLRGKCESRLVNLVGKSLDSAREASLKRALGPKFTEYASTYRQEQQRDIEARQSLLPPNLRDRGIRRDIDGFGRPIEPRDFKPREIPREIPHEMPHPI